MLAIAFSIKLRHNNCNFILKYIHKELPCITYISIGNKVSKFYETKKTYENLSTTLCTTNIVWTQFEKKTFRNSQTFAYFSKCRLKDHRKKMR